MPRTIVLTFRLAACWSLPAILADAHVVLAQAVRATIDWTNWVLADVEPNSTNRQAPTSGAKALALHAHAMGGAIRHLKFCIEIWTMLVFAILSKPSAPTVTCTNCSIPLPIRRIARRVQIDQIGLLGFLLFHLNPFLHNLLNFIT